MFLHGLKLNITLHLAILIALGMLLINIVMLSGFQGIFIRHLMSKASLLSTVIQSHAIDDLEKGEKTLSEDTKRHIRSILDEAGLECTLVLNSENQSLFNYQQHCGKIGLLKQIIPEAMSTRHPVIQFSDKAWHVFWNKDEYLSIAQPLENNGRIYGGVGMVLQLKGVYKALSKIQSLFWSYFGINLFVLTVVGLYQFTKIMVKPIHRLLSRAEAYREESEIVFSDEDKNNEFNRLSSALNRMFMGISKDRETLKETVKSLEQVNMDLKKAQKELVRAEKLASVGRLSSGIAHEIGNPIGIVLGYLNLLKRDDLSTPEKDDFILRAESEINRINVIVRQLLDFSKPSTDELNSFSINALLKEIAEVITPQPFMSQIELSCHLLAQKDMVTANPDLLRQVFFNLLLNAADAVSTDDGNAGGKIDIKTENIDRFDPELMHNIAAIKISVSDNGPGISKEHLEYIFDPFFTTKEPGKGTGLGLSVSFMIVENMGGTIEAEDGRLKGAVISVILPLVKENPNASV